jgi:hypothetical protein
MKPTAVKRDSHRQGEPGEFTMARPPSPRYFLNSLRAPMLSGPEAGRFVVFRKLATDPAAIAIGATDVDHQLNVVRVCRPIMSAFRHVVFADLGVVGGSCQEPVPPYPSAPVTISLAP